MKFIVIFASIVLMGSGMVLGALARVGYVEHQVQTAIYYKQMYSRPCPQYGDRAVQACPAVTGGFNYAD